jgi:hypothetical protein
LEPVTSIFPLNELTILGDEKDDINLNFVIRLDKLGNWSFQYANQKEPINEKVNPDLYDLLKDENRQSLFMLNENIRFKKKIVALLVKKGHLCLDENIWLISLLYAAGFLTILPNSQVTSASGHVAYTFMIPNKSVYESLLVGLELKWKYYHYLRRERVIELSTVNPPVPRPELSKNLQQFNPASHSTLFEPKVWEKSLKAAHLIVFSKGDNQDNSYFYKNSICFSFNKPASGFLSQHRTALFANFSLASTPFSREFQEKIKMAFDVFSKDIKAIKCPEIRISSYSIEVYTDTFAQRELIHIVFDRIMQDVDPSISEILEDVYKVINIPSSDDFHLRQVLNFNPLPEIPSDVGIDYTFSPQSP